MSRHCQHSCEENASFRKLKVCKDALIKGNLEVSKDVSVGGDLSVTGSTTLTDVNVNNLQVQNVNISGDASIGGALDVTGCVTADGLVLENNETKPCGDANNVLWVKDDHLMFTDKNGQDNIVQTEKDDPIYQLVKGRWTLQTKKFVDQDAVFEFLDTYEDPDFGTTWNARLLAGLKSQISQLTLEQQIFYQTNVGVDPNLFSAYTLDGDLTRLCFFYPPDGFFLTGNALSTFKVQNDNPENAIYCTSTDYQNVTQSQLQLMAKYKKQNKDVLQPVQPYNESNLYGQVDFTDPLFIFNYAFSVLSQELSPQLAKDANTVGYQGYLPFTAWRNKLIDEGVVRKSEVLNVLKSQSSRVSTRYGFSTTIITKCPHKLCRASNVTLSGFINEYSILNGTFPVTILDFANVSYPEPYQSPTGYLYCFNVLVDTSSLPVFDMAKHTAGGATVVAQHGPVKDIASDATNDYRQLLSCIYELLDFMGISTHTLFQPIVTNTNSAIIPRSMQELSALVSARTYASIYGSSVSSYSAVFNTRRVADCAQWNVNGALLNIAAGSTSLLTSMLSNDKYNIAPYPGSLWDFNIVRETYLQPGSVRNIFARPVGTPIGAPGSNISWFLNSIGWVNQGGTGSTFEFKAFNPQALPPASENWQLITGALPSAVGSVPNLGSQSFFCGIIRPEFTNGEKVGYLRIRNYFQPAYWDLFTDAEDGPLASPINQFVKMWAAAIGYLNSEGVTRIIFDNRANSGGSFTAVKAFSQIWGANRGSAVDSFVDRNNGNKTPETVTGNLETGNYPNGVQGVLDNVEVLRPNEVALALGESAVFRGNDSQKKVITVLTSKSAGSGGDSDVTSVFVNPDPNDPTNLGSNTYAKIIGSIDGRLFSAQSQLQFFPNDDSYNLITSDGVPVSPIRLNCEGPNLITYVDQRTQKYYNNQVPQWAPQILLDDSFNIIYRNLGYQPLTPGSGTAYLLPVSSFNAIGRTGIPVPGNPNDPTTWSAARLSWRDIWLETAITNGNL
jgi:hypothetical protein